MNSYQQDLFQDPNLKDKLRTSLLTWVDDLHPLVLNELSLILTRLKPYYAKDKPIIYPHAKDIFRVFRTLPLKDIKVVILGRNPYYSYDNANGFSFGCKNFITPSLKEICRAMKNDLKVDTPEYFDRTLLYLVKQGVFLLNTKLTVEEGNPDSHEEIYWERFTTKVIETISKQENIVFLLWGAKAQKFRKYIDETGNLVLEEEHPASAARNDYEWVCNHFTETNEFLINNFREPIQWLFESKKQ